MAKSYPEGAGCLDAWLRLCWLSAHLRAARIRAISSICEGTPDAKTCPMKEREQHVSANFMGREQLSDAVRVIVITLQLTLIKPPAIIV